MRPNTPKPKPTWLTPINDRNGQAFVCERCSRFLTDSRVGPLLPHEEWMHTCRWCWNCGTRIVRCASGACLFEHAAGAQQAVVSDLLCLLHEELTAAGRDATALITRHYTEIVEHAGSPEEGSWYKAWAVVGWE